MDRKLLSGWVEGYERLWRTPGTDDLPELFTENAFYSMGPFARQETGLADVSRLWDEERKSPDEPFEMSWEIIALDGDTGVVRVEVRYGPPRHEHYRDLWIVRLGDDGRCFHFEEWPHWPDHGTSAGKN